MAEYDIWVCALALSLFRCGIVSFGVICPQLKADYSCWQSSSILVPGVEMLVLTRDLLAGSLQLLFAPSVVDTETLVSSFQSCVWALNMRLCSSSLSIDSITSSNKNHASCLFSG